MLLNAAQWTQPPQKITQTRMPAVLKWRSWTRKEALLRYSVSWADQGKPVSAYNRLQKVQLRPGDRKQWGSTCSVCAKSCHQFPYLYIDMNETQGVKGDCHGRTAVSHSQCLTLSLCMEKGEETPFPQKINLPSNYHCVQRPQSLPALCYFPQTFPCSASITAFQSVFPWWLPPLLFPPMLHTV